MKNTKATFYIAIISVVVIIAGCTAKNVEVVPPGDKPVWEIIKIKPFAGIKVRLKGKKNSFEVKHYTLNQNLYIISSFPKGISFPVYPGSKLHADQPYRRGWHQYFYTIPDGKNFEDVYTYYMKTIKQ